DQLRSLAEIKADMEQPYPMDRLLCGDVGFGKTEVAFLAAFKAILGGKQVAFLCPTTLLARQHYETAKQRFQNVPIGIGMLSRFVPPAVQKKTLSDLKEGRLSMVIGTHRLLSNDLVFRDLGLLIVDEEQRFGVEHKEKIKELKRNIDVLTLSATPIPRTMQMALLGVRNLSQIETPPLHRLPVQTYVMEKNPRLIKEVIERELGRGGQVFYLCNEIDALPGIAATLQKQIPGANIIIIHGQMDRDDIEDAMIRFQAGEANVMVCTTIIENGIDIPNANTIVVDRADTFGLAQLYQIKGRVGRSDRLAYAYLLYRPRKQLSEVAIKRLRAIKEFVELGSGYRIAMRDLSIRGAGDILGAEQAGFIDTVGIDLYLQLLQETIEEKRTGIPTPEPEVPRPLQVDAYIPKPYTNDDLDKIELYKKIDAIQDLEGLSTLQEMMRDVYGKLPLSVELLLEKRRLELTLRNELVEEVKDSATAYEIVFTPMFSSYDGIGIDLFRIANQLSNHLLLSYRGGRIRMKLHKEEPEWLKLASRFLEKTWQLVQRYQTGQPH
ncbi:MAG: DEAD/DEAH box helicase, partial [Bacilli bacterium]